MLEAIKNRRSVRSFAPEPVEPHTLREIIRAAVMAPSPYNIQPWKFYVVADAQTKQGIRQVYDTATARMKLLKKLHIVNTPIYDQDTSFIEAATLIITCYNRKVPFARDALSLAAENLMIEAAARSLGTLMMGRPTALPKHRRTLRRLAGVEKNYEIPWIIGIGKPAKPLAQMKAPPRKPMEEIVQGI